MKKVVDGSITVRAFQMPVKFEMDMDRTAAQNANDLENWIRQVVTDYVTGQNFFKTQVNYTINFRLGENDDLLPL